MNKKSLLLATLIVGFSIAEALPSPAQLGATPIQEWAVVTTLLRLASCTPAADTVVAQQPASYSWHDGGTEKRRAVSGEQRGLERDV